MKGKTENTVWFEKIEEFFSIELKETNLYVAKLWELTNKVAEVHEPVPTEEAKNETMTGHIGDEYASRLLNLCSLLSAHNRNLARIVSHLSEFV